MTEELQEQENLSKKEQKALVREQAVMANYQDKEGKFKEGVQLLGKDNKMYYLYNPANEDLMIEACNNSGLDIEVKAFSDVFIMDAWFAKPKSFVCQIKKIGGKDLANPLLKDRRLILTVNGDVFYSMSEKRRKYHLLKELSRILYNYEKNSYKILKWEYQNNNVIMDLFGANPTETDLERL